MKSRHFSERAVSSSDILEIYGEVKKRKRTDSTDSGVLQPTGFQYRIIFADAGCIARRLERSLIKDERKHLETEELVEAAVLYEASIVIGSDFPAYKPPKDSNMSHLSCETIGDHPTSWHIWFDEEEWSVSQLRSVPMSPMHPRMQGRE